MAVNDKLINAFNRITELAGTQLRIRYYNPVYDDTYDEETELVLDSEIWVSGIVLPVNSREGSSDSVLLQQGKVIDSDKKIYVNGSVAFAGSTQLVDVQLGSPNGNLYTTIPDGGIMWETNGTPVYKQQFIRRLTGSLLDTNC